MSNSIPSQSSHPNLLVQFTIVMLVSVSVAKVLWIQLTVYLSHIAQALAPLGNAIR